MSRAMALRSVATESSRSRINPSAPDIGPLTSLRSESAGTNRKERISCLTSWASLFLGALEHQRLAGALRHDLAALVDRGMAELDDPGIGPRLAFAHRDHRGLNQIGRAHV